MMRPLEFEQEMKMDSYKSILVYVDNTPRCAVRLNLASDLARAHGAHLIGVSVVNVLQAIPMMAGEASVMLMERQAEIATEAADEADEIFRKHAETLDIETELRRYEGATSDIVALNARYADLTVLGQAALEAKDASVADYLPEQIALQAGRPVLVVPDSGDNYAVGERVLVAWNASREATRAVYDAMPVLQRAKQVTVLAVNPDDAHGEHGQVPSADIALQLARHGVKAEARHTVAKEIDAGNEILARAADLGADLIVCGAYGHSRLRELVLGGVTRTLLNHMTVPVLMSH